MVRELEVLACVVLLSACSRTGDLLPGEGTGGAGGAPSTTGAGSTGASASGPSTSGPSTTSTSATGAPASSSAETSGATTSGNPVDCVLCIANQCPEIAACVTDPVCAEGLACVVTDCGVQGLPDFGCVADCFGGDLDAAIAALQALACVVTTCGSDCAAFLPQGA